MKDIPVTLIEEPNEVRSLEKGKIVMVASGAIFHDITWCVYTGVIPCGDEGIHRFLSQAFSRDGPMGVRPLERLTEVAIPYSKITCAGSPFGAINFFGREHLPEQGLTRDELNAIENHYNLLSLRKVSGVNRGFGMHYKPGDEGYDEGQRILTELKLWREP